MRSSSSSSNEVRQLLIEDERIKVFSVTRTDRGGRSVRKNKIYSHDEPQFDLETIGFVASDLFLTETTKNNRHIALGILKDGDLDRNDAEKRYYFGKLNLKPKSSQITTVTPARLPSSSSAKEDPTTKASPPTRNVSTTTTTTITTSDSDTRNAFGEEEEDQLETNPLSTPPPSDHSG